MAVNLTKNIAVAEKLEVKLLKSVKDIQNEISQAVDDLIKEFEIKNGKFVPETDFPFIIATLNRRIERIIKESKLESEVLKFIDDFDLIDKNIKALQSGLNGIRVDPEIFNNQRAWVIDNTVNSLLESNISTKFIQPVKTILYNRVAFGGSVVDAELQLREIIKGKPGELGVFERWVGQIARDAVNEYQGGINAQIKVQYDLPDIRYVGGLVEDSRAQCVRWVDEFNGRLLGSQLQAEIDWAYRNGSGMKPDTTVGNFPQKRGGYNCTHIAIPTKF